MESEECLSGLSGGEAKDEGQLVYQKEAALTRLLLRPIRSNVDGPHGGSADATEPCDETTEARPVRGVPSGHRVTTSASYDHVMDDLQRILDRLVVGEEDRRMFEEAARIVSPHWVAYGVLTGAVAATTIDASGL